MTKEQYQQKVSSFFEDPIAEWTKWFEPIELLNVQRYLKEDFGDFDGTLKGFLDSDKPRLRHWFQPKTNLWERLKKTMLDDFDRYEPL